MEYRYQHAGKTIVVNLEATAGVFRASIDGRVVQVELVRGSDGRLVFSLDGVRHRAWTAADGALRWVALDGQAAEPWQLSVPGPGRRARRAQAGGHEDLTAQMPGVVRRVLTAAGDQVERGQVLLLLEAMKMEIRVAAPVAGVVEQVRVSDGQAVDRGQVLVALVSRE
jgi:biotin carboxyl carrier protein